MADVQLLEYLEYLTSRKHVMELLEENGHLGIRFDEYPKGPE